jgi:hypothetical protein
VSKNFRAGQKKKNDFWNKDLIVADDDLRCRGSDLCLTSFTRSWRRPKFLTWITSSEKSRKDLVHIYTLCNKIQPLAIGMFTQNKNLVLCDMNYVLYVMKFVLYDMKSVVWHEFCVIWHEFFVVWHEFCVLRHAICVVRHAICVVHMTWNLYCMTLILCLITWILCCMIHFLFCTTWILCLKTWILWHIICVLQYALCVVLYDMNFVSYDGICILGKFSPTYVLSDFFLCVSLYASTTQSTSDYITNLSKPKFNLEIFGLIFFHWKRYV